MVINQENKVEVDYVYYKEHLYISYMLIVPFPGDTVNIKGKMYRIINREFNTLNPNSIKVYLELCS